MNILVGTSGFSYKEWKGRFYPEKLPADQMLGYYSARFPTVEMNNTFYRMPTEKVLLDWAAEVPESFVFAVKAPQRITHIQRLKEAGEETDYFLRTVNVLGARLGPTLFQLPPNMKKDFGRLQGFLELLPDRWKAAFEFRNASWYTDDVFEALRARDFALAVADTGEEGDAPFVATASWGYLKLRRVEYEASRLEKWAHDVKEQAWTDAYVYFKHEDEATGPRLAAEFASRVAGWAGGQHYYPPARQPAYPPIATSLLHCSSLAGTTDRRPMRTSPKSMNAESALMAGSPTGFGSFFPARRFTTISLPPFALGSG